NGSDELIALSLRAIINKGDEVIVSYPTFLIYEIQAKIHSAKIIRVPFKEFRYSLTEILKNISNKTKIIFIANPDNPTGTYLTQKEVEAFMIKVPDNVLVFFDEAYFEFAPSDYPDTLKLLKKKKNIFVSRTFSKAYGLAGIRIGYGVGSKELANVMNKIREPFNVNRLAQAGAIAALENDIFLKKVLNYVQKEKFYLYKEFNKLGIQFVKSATNFIMVDFNQDTSNLNDYLLKKGIIIRELKGWGMNNFFRVSIGKHKENKYFIHCLKKYMGLDK
ncbi:MAG: histidinol-phosphate transaminase, partial [Candidatus Omnitrophica bacterium]|nr:histidinol-phosphate transaminase [Candidatus Omnitrophota bacterium]